MLALSRLSPVAGRRLPPVLGRSGDGSGLPGMQILLPGRPLIGLCARMPFVWTGRISMLSPTILFSLVAFKGRPNKNVLRSITGFWDFLAHDTRVVAADLLLPRDASRLTDACTDCKQTTRSKYALPQRYAGINMSNCQEYGCAHFRALTRRFENHAHPAIFVSHCVPTKPS